MTVTPLASLARPSEPDAPLAPRADGFGAALANALQSVAGTLERADAAERSFASGKGDLLDMVLDRAQADVALSLASGTASHVSQALGTILGMQV